MPNGDDFRKAFARAKKSGAKTFTYNGKSYTTQTADEKAKSMTPKQKLDAYNKAYSNERDHFYKTGKPSKSKSEVTRSYQNAAAKDPEVQKIVKKRNESVKKKK